VLDERRIAFGHRAVALSRDAIAFAGDAIIGHGVLTVGSHVRAPAVANLATFVELASVSLVADRGGTGEPIALVLVDQFVIGETLLVDIRVRFVKLCFGALALRLMLSDLSPLLGRIGAFRPDPGLLAMLGAIRSRRRCSSRSRRRTRILGPPSRASATIATTTTIAMMMTVDNSPTSISEHHLPLPLPEAGPEQVLSSRATRWWRFRLGLDECSNRSRRGGPSRPTSFNIVQRTAFFSSGTNASTSGASFGSFAREHRERAGPAPK
jgi:hypothetical protein